MQIPSRVSIDDMDDGFQAYRALVEDGFTVEVYLNGKLQLTALTADAEEGFVKRFKLNEHAELFLDGDVPATETLKGAVEIKAFKKMNGG